MLLEPPTRQRKSPPKEHRAKRRREPSRWTVVGWTPQDANCPNAKRHPNAKTSKQKNIFPYYHRASKVHGHDLGSCLRRESGVGDRHGRAPRVGQCFNLGIELMRKRFDDAGAESDFLLSKDVILSANPVVGDRQLPVRSGPIITNADFTDDFLVGKRMLESIHNEFGDNKADALGLTGGSTTDCADHFQRNWPAVADH